MTISNDLIYGGRLRCGAESVAKRRLEVKCIPGVTDWIAEVMKPERSVIFIDYEGVEGTDEIKNGEQIENPGECELIEELLDCMVSSGVNIKDIGLMSFYNGQLLRFKKTLDECIVNDLEMLTADKFQGRDKEVIIISFVRTDGVGGLLKEMRRINVAMTRAKSKLVIFGDGGFIKKEIPDMMSSFEKRNWVLKPQGITIDSTSQSLRMRSQVRSKIRGDILSNILAELDQ